MKIKCPHCGKGTIITHNNRYSQKSLDLYVNCLNIDCGARFVMRVSHAYDITPPAETLTNALHEIIANMPADERTKLLRLYAN